MRDDDRAYVLDHLHELVVKPANESGGYGMLIGPRASAQERADFARLIRAEPRNYMAQPMLGISTAPPAPRMGAWRRAMSICAPLSCKGRR